MFSSSLLAVPVSRDSRVTAATQKYPLWSQIRSTLLSGCAAILEVKDGRAHIIRLLSWKSKILVRRLEQYCWRWKMNTHQYIIRLLSWKSKILVRCLEQYCWRWKMNTHQYIICLLSLKSKILVRCLEQYCWRWKMNTHQYIIRLLSCKSKILPRCLEQYCWRWKMDNNNNIHLSCVHQRHEHSHDPY